MLTFPRGDILYRLNPERVFTDEDSTMHLTAGELARSRSKMDERAWRKRLAIFLVTSPQLRAFDRESVVVDLASPWPISVKSHLHCSFDGRKWTLHLDPRLGTEEEVLAVIHSMALKVAFGNTAHSWNAATWKEAYTHHVLRQDGWRCHLFGSDPRVLMAMMVSLQTNQEKAKGFNTQS